MKRFAMWLFLCTLAFLAPAGLSAQAPSGDQSTAPKGATSATPRTTHMTTDPALLHPATLIDKAPDSFQVKFETTKGDFVVQVTRSW